MPEHGEVDRPLLTPCGKKGSDSGHATVLSTVVGMIFC